MDNWIVIRATDIPEESFPFNGQWVNLATYSEEPPVRMEFENKLTGESFEATPSGDLEEHAGLFAEVWKVAKIV